MLESGRNPKYFVTGATGFIGNRLARRLLTEGFEVVALARSPHAARDLKSLGATIVQGDVTDRESIRHGMKGVDGVFHLAANFSFGRRQNGDMEPVNVGGTRNVLRTMRDLRIPKGVYTSSVVVFSDTQGQIVDENYFFEGPQLSEYARTKWVAHYDVAKSMIFDGLPLVIVQPGTVIGPGDHSVMADMFIDYLRRRLPAIPSGAVFSWTHVDDVVEGHFLAMTKGKIGESYILAGESHSLADVMQEAARMSRRRPPAIHMPPRVVRGLAHFMNMLEYIAPLPQHLTAEALRMSAGRTFTVSSEKAKRELGFTARSLSSGLKGTLTDLASRIANRDTQPYRR